MQNNVAADSFSAAIKLIVAIVSVTAIDTIPASVHCSGHNIRDNPAVVLPKLKVPEKSLATSCCAVIHACRCIYAPRCHVNIARVVDYRRWKNAAGRVYCHLLEEFRLGGQR